MTDTRPLSEVRKECLKILAGSGNVEYLTDDLVSGLLEIPRLEVAMRDSDRITERRVTDLLNAAKRVAAGEPIQYVLGFAEFMGHRFEVDSRVLIPRPETEQLVEQLLAILPASGHVVDCGTGSGCIAISVALANSRLTVTAVDRSSTALQVAQENARRHECDDRIDFVKGDLLQGIDDADVIVANLPYISEEEFPGLAPNVREHEPREALVADEQGLSLIYELIEQSKNTLKSGGHLCLEFGWEQGDAVRTRLKMAGCARIRILKDYQGYDRIGLAQWQDIGC